MAGETVNGDVAWTPASGTSFPVYTGNGGYSGNTAVLTTDTGYTLIHTAEEVSVSTNVLTWRPVTQSPQYPYQTRNLPNLVVNSQNHLIRIAGQANGFQNDVYLSSDTGRSWRTQTTTAPFAERFTATAFNLRSADNLGGADVVYVIGGRSSRDNYNDVWASSDEGRTWVAINPSAPFMQRSSAGGVVTKDGVLVIVGGFADDDEGQFNQKIANDVWASMDGGYSWGRCVLDAEWDDRFQQVVTLDDQGYLYIMGGGTGTVDMSVLQDVWRSTVSFSDTAAVARVCGLTVPACGIGLKCWPGPGTVKATDGSYISCDACPYGGAGGGAAAASAQTGLIVALVVFILLFLAAAGVAYFFWKKTKGGGLGGRRRLGRRTLERWIIRG